MLTIAIQIPIIEVTF